MGDYEILCVVPFCYEPGNTVRLCKGLNLKQFTKQIKMIIIIFKTKTYFCLQFQKQDAIMQTCT